MAQRWVVVSSQAALERAEARVTKACQRASEAIDQQLLHWQAPRYATPEAAHAALAHLATSWRYHQGETSHLIEHKHYARQGKPTPTAPIKSIDWPIQAQVCPAQQGIEERQQQGACFGIGSNIEANQLRDGEVSAAYKAQAQAEGGLRFLKDPMFFVSSLFVKKPCRMQGLLMVMTLALRVYAVTQRRLRQQLARQHETLPNQITQPTERPTVRWGFQRLEGIPRVRMTVQSQRQDLIVGLNDVQMKILRLFGEAVCRLYQISPG